MFFGRIPGITTPGPNKDEEKPKERDEELENILGNLLVAKYQVKRLEDRLSDKVSNNHRNSTFLFKQGESWYNVKIMIDKQEEKKDPESECNLCGIKLPSVTELKDHLYINHCVFFPEEHDNSESVLYHS